MSLSLSSWRGRERIASARALKCLRVMWRAYQKPSPRSRAWAWWRVGQPRNSMEKEPLSMALVTASSMSEESTLSERLDSRSATCSSRASRRALMGVWDWVSSSVLASALGRLARASVTASLTMGVRASLRDWARASVRKRVMVSFMVCGVGWVGWVVSLMTQTLYPIRRGGSRGRPRASMRRVSLCLCACGVCGRVCGWVGVCMGIYGVNPYHSHIGA